MFQWQFEGYFCPNTQLSNIFPCLSGTFSTGAQKNCTKCSAGYSCPYTSLAVKVACATGTYSSGGQTK